MKVILLILMISTPLQAQRTPFEIYVDGYQCVNPECPDCEINSDIEYDISESKITAKTEFIFKGGFENQ